mgnify:CR=1 FL=1
MKRKAPTIVISYFVDAEHQFIKMNAIQHEGNLNMNEMIKKIHQAVIKQSDDMLIKCEEKPIAVNKEISDLKKEIEQKTVLVGKLSDQLEAAEKLHNKDLKALKDKDDQLLAIVESKEQAERERDYFVNHYKQSESVVNSLKAKIERERIIILIVIAILIGLFF